ncbi:MAG: PASTA domain-containing protein, partial [Clostridiales bacterium]
KLTLGNISQKFSKDYDEGTVMYQSVKSGTTVNEGASVSLTVSKGPEEPAEPKAKTTTYSHTVSSNYDGNVSVTIEVSDSQGDRTVYSGTRAPGENVSTSVTYYAPGILYYYENGSLIDQKSL